MMDTMLNHEAINTKPVKKVTHCQVCAKEDLRSLLFVGYLPPVNKMTKIGDYPIEQESFPAELIQCSHCQLVQLSVVVGQELLFPTSYPYTSGTTKILRENFADLYRESSSLLNLRSNDLIVDIGSNDGTLLSNFSPYHQVQGITPEDIGYLAQKKNIPTFISYFNKQAVAYVLKERGSAKVVTATNVFAHMDHIRDILSLIQELLSQDGVFISESHYLLPLLETVQYDTIYHEHLRYYSLQSLTYLFESQGMEIFHVKRIGTHGGSIRVYTAKKGLYPIQDSVRICLEEEKQKIHDSSFEAFKHNVLLSKLELQSFILKMKMDKKKIYGVGAPSRASTLIHYVGINEQMVDCILEVKGSYKIGHYIPGTLIPIVNEEKMFQDPPDYLLLFSWHIADELMKKIKLLGYKGDFLVPLPHPHVVKNSEIS